MLFDSVGAVLKQCGSSAGAVSGQCRSSVGAVTISVLNIFV